MSVGSGSEEVAAAANRVAWGEAKERNDEVCRRGAERCGAQHMGIQRGFGGTKAKVERGKSRRLAERSNDAVVNVMAKATAKRS